MGAVGASRLNHRTAWRYYKTVRRLFNWSVEEGLLEESPVKGIHFKPLLPSPIQPYSIEELKRFLAVCELDIRTGLLLSA